jgi:glycine/D-amino acid oxidase-like deaminating enzyme
MSQSSLAFHALQSQSPVERTIIIGSGITGASLSHYLTLCTQSRVVVIDRSLERQLGSTGHAPGFIGQLSENSILTKLARESVQAYLAIPDGFEACGGVEIATTPEAVIRLKGRQSLALKNGLPASMLTAEDTIALAPDFVQPHEVIGALRFPSDGAAHAVLAASFFKSSAESRGAIFLEADFLRPILESGTVTGVETRLGKLSCSSLVLATGIWTSALTRELNLPFSIPVVSVAHPYIHSSSHLPRSYSTPFIRWPEHQLYARDHGTFNGVGSYHHTPYPIDNDKLGTTAFSDWPSDFSHALDEARTHFPAHTSQAFSISASSHAFSGIFALTPDNLPLLGPIPTCSGVYLAAAIWITHAPGCARLLADMMTGRNVAEDFIQALRPDRFAGRADEELRMEAVRKYNEIYNAGSQVKNNTSDVRI